MSSADLQDLGADPTDSSRDFNYVALLLPNWRRLAIGALVGGAVGLGAAFIIPPVFTARAAFISPQPQQGPAAAALASLGALSSIAGAATGVRTPIDQYVSLLQSVTVADRIVDKFNLQELYDKDYRAATRKELWQRLHITQGKKDNLIVIEVDDTDPKRAADMANAFISELRTLSNGLALTEAQQRRTFFEQHLNTARDRLSQAQIALQKSGINAGALKNEPKFAAESYGRTKALIAAAEVRLQAMRRTLNENAVEVQQQAAALSSLRAQLSSIEQPTDSTGNQDYVGAYREFKYQETLFEIYSRQFELAKLDESREGLLFQVVDPATPPERKSKPKRSLITLGGVAAGLLISLAYLIVFTRRRTLSNI